MLTLMMLKSWSAKIIDIETAFSEGDLDEEIFMRIPNGHEELLGRVDEEEVLELLKSIYGLV